MYDQTLHWLDYVVIIISLLISLYVGAYFAKRQTSTQNYYAASGSIPSWAVGLSILATLISSVTFLAYPGQGFSSNWLLLVQGIAVVFVLLGLVWFVVPLYRKVIGISAYEYFEKRFGFYARLYSSLAFAFAHGAKMGTVFFLMGLALSSIIGIDTYLIIWIVGFVVIFITLKGGIEGVIWLDVIQGFMLIGGGLLALAIVFFTVDGGIVEVFTVAFEYDKISFAPYDWDFTKLTFIVLVFNGVFYGIQKYGTDQTIVQRYLTAKSEKGAIRAAMTGVILSLPVWTLFMFLGTALFVYYMATPESLPANIAPDAVFPYFILTQIPIGLTGFIIAALMAASISSLDSDLNCLSAIVVEDYYIRFKKDATDGDKLKFGKRIIIIAGFLSLIAASTYVYLGSEGILEIIFGLYAIFSGGIAGIFILGIFTKRTNKQGLYIGIVTCIIFTAWAVLTSTDFGSGALIDLGDWNFTHHEYMMGVYSHLIVIIVGYFSSFLFPHAEVNEDFTIHAWYKNRKQRRIDTKNDPTD